MPDSSSIELFLGTAPICYAGKGQTEFALKKDTPFREDDALESWKGLMAILKEMVGKKIIDGFKGVVDFYYWMGIPCARVWPRSQGKSQTPESVAQWPIFKTAAKLWGELSPEVKTAYNEMASVTNLTGKDMFFRGYISGTLRYYEPVDDMMEKD